MNKTVDAKQLDLVEGMTREEMILATAPHIDPDAPQLKEDMMKLGWTAVADAAREALGEERDYDDFDWSSDPSVVLREQRATAVYLNRWNGLVIRQEKSWDEESDPFLVITRENSDVFLDRLCDLLGIPSAGGPAR